MKAVEKPPVIYFVFRVDTGPKSTRFQGFVTRLKKSGFMPKADMRAVAMQDMTFVVDNKQRAKILAADGSELFSDASFVYFKSWEGMDEHAAMIANYLIAKGVPFEDSVVGAAGKNKASQIWKLWAQGIGVVPTVFSATLPGAELLLNNIGPAPYLIKPFRSEKGRGVAKYDSYEALARANVEWNQMLVQPFIPNNGDWRVLVYGYQTRGALYRQAAKGAIVNNTSQGATSFFVEPKEVDPDIASVAERAATATGYAVAGVDVMSDPSGTPLILEINQGAQVATGGAVNDKMRAFGEYLHEVLEHRYPRKAQNTRLPVLGRYVHVNLPELKAKNIFAKVDTGAYQSAVHATDIREIRKPEGGMALEFRLLDGHPRAGETGKLCQVDEYEVARVRNSFGIIQNRYIIKTRISIKGRMMKTGITLTDRKDMVAPLLLGRRFLRGRYVVNVELSRLDFERKS